jgi:hypothetical protein
MQLLLMQLMHQLFTSAAYWLLDGRDQRSLWWLWHNIFGGILQFRCGDCLRLDENVFKCEYFRSTYPQLFVCIDTSLWSETVEAFSWYTQRYVVSVCSSESSDSPSYEHGSPFCPQDLDRSDMLGRISSHLSEPLFKISQEFQEERIMLNNFWDIPRSIPRHRREVLCRKLFNQIIT